MRVRAERWKAKAMKQAIPRSDNESDEELQECPSTMVSVLQTPYTWIMLILLIPVYILSRGS